MSRVGLAVAVVAVLFCVSSVVCEEEGSSDDLCSGSYRCRAVKHYSKRRDATNLTTVTEDQFERLYFNTKLWLTSCTLSGVYTFGGSGSGSPPSCYTGVNLRVLRTNSRTYTALNSQTAITFYDDGFSTMLYVKVCDIGDITNPCGCGPYEDCACGISQVFECLPVDELLVEQIADTCANSLTSFSSGTCE
jgi:hypothetical protein